MNDKKNLDRLFQEKFKDFEVEPNEQVWRNIELALRGEKKKKRVIPFWYRLSGVAAALLICGFIANAILSSDEIPQNAIVIDDNNAKTIDQNNGVATETSTKNTLDKERSSQNEVSNTNDLNKIPTEKSGIKNTDNKVVSTDKKSQDIDPKVTSKNSNVQNAVAEGSGIKNSTISGDNKNGVVSKTKKSAGIDSQVSPRNSNIQDAVAQGSKTKTNTVQNTVINGDSENAVASKNKKTKANKIGENESNQASPIKTETGIVQSNTKNQTDAVTGSNQENSAKNQQTSVAHNQNEQKNTIQKSANPIVAQPGTTVAQNVDSKKLDSAAVATVEPNALEELLKENEKEKIAIAETKSNRWQVTPQIAPIYFGSASNGSPIDQQFAGNEKTYEKNMSYGVAVNYAVNKKFNIRTGINKLTLGYDTRDVSFSAGLVGKSFQNISAPANAPNIQVVSASAADGLLPFETTLQGIKTGSISQTMGYIEVPMELSYKLVDKKFGVNLIGGVSTLFLDENKVKISSADISSSLGKANNLSDVHFSSNLGIGFRYSFWDSFDFNFEPTIKYQINTFSKNSGDFKPYFLGLYSGISFKF